MELLQGQPDEIAAAERISVLFEEYLEEGMITDLGEVADVETANRPGGANDQSEAWRPWARDRASVFGTEVLGLKPSAKQLEYGLNWYTDDQLEIENSVLRFKRTLVKSCNGGGKTFWGALTALQLHNSGFRVLITASTLAQANAGVGAEIRRLKAYGPSGLSGQWMPSEMHARFTDLHEMLTFSVQVGTQEEIAGSAAGRHYRRMALIVDEGNSANAKMLEQVDRICLSPHDRILVLINATPPSCYIRRAAAIGDLWNTVTINGYNHPNVVHKDPEIIPGAITQEFIDDQLEKAGGNRSHFLFAPPVLGEFADNSSDGLIQEAWVRRAMQRWEDHHRIPDYRGTALSLDVASTGGDASSMWGMKDWKLFRPMIPQDFVNRAETREKFPTLRAGATWLRGREVQDSVDMVYGATHCVPDVRVISIDASGLGQGPVGQLQKYRKNLASFVKYVRHERSVQKSIEMKPAIIGHTFGSSPILPAKLKFKKFKDQLLWNLREALRLDMVDIPPPHVQQSYGLGPDVDLMEELLRPIFGVDSTGHLIVADKSGAECADEDMRKRCAQMPSASPNELHSIALCLWDFMKLTSGPKPITTSVELRKVEMETLKKRARDQYAKRGKFKRAALPWQIRR